MKVRSVNLHASGKAGNSKNDLFAHVPQSPEHHPVQLRILTAGAAVAKFL
jgi:hypothetical protein